MSCSQFLQTCRLSKIGVVSVRWHGDTESRMYLKRVEGALMATGLLPDKSS
jgi:hypothetical protein